MKQEISLDTYDSLNDFLFYKYMCEEGNEELQKEFLKSMGVAIRGNFRIKNQKLAPEIVDYKTCIFDFVAETEDTLINLELQQQKTIDFRERLVYYMNKLANLRKGNNYKETKNIIIVAIVNFKMNDLPNYKHIYKLINTKDLNDIFIEKSIIIIIELPKFRKSKKDLTKKEHRYLTFIDKYTSHFERKELMKMDETLKVAVKQMEKALQNEDALRAYYRIEMEKMRIENEIQEGTERGMKEGIKEGMNKGIQKGTEEASIKYAKKLKEIGMPLKKISEVIELPIETIKKL